MSGTTIDVEAYPIFSTQTEVVREQCSTSKDTGYCIVRIAIPDYWFNSSYTNALITFKENGIEQIYTVAINYPFVPALQPLDESSVFLVAPSTTFYSGQTFYVEGYIFVTGFSTIESMEVVIHANTNFGDKNTWVVPSIWREILCKFIIYFFKIYIQWKPLNRDTSGVGILSHLSGSPD